VSQTLPRSEILRGRKKFELVFREGRVISGRFFRCIFSADPRLEIPAGTGVLFGVAVPRRQVRRAVDRNRIKRLVRESYRRNKTAVHSPGTSASPFVLMFVYTPRADQPHRSLPFREVERDVVNILSKVQSKLSAEVSR